MRNTSLLVVLLLLGPAVLVRGAAEGRQGRTRDLFLRQEATSLQEKTIKAIEHLSSVLSDLKETIKREGSEASSETPTSDGKMEGGEGLQAVMLDLTTALRNHTEALLENARNDGGSAGCDVPYWRLGQECFYVNQRRRVSWSEAREFCRGLGGDLAQPSAVARLRAAILMKYPEDYNTFFWVGASEAGGSEGNWRWLSGVRVRTEDWARDQPDGGNENCVGLSRDEHPSLHDSPCYTHTTFICQAFSQAPAADATTATPA